MSATPKKTVIGLAAILATMSLAFESSASEVPEKVEPTNEAKKWSPLFNEKSLDGWKVSEFGGQGEVYVENQQINMDFGSPMTGITYKGEFPKTNYELTFDAKRVDGTDFFCGLTFPVGKDYCSLILGGWGGTVVGLSNIDGEDASENPTNQLIAFKKDRWYKILLKVGDSNIDVWIDGKKIISQDRTNHKISIRPEVDLSCPLGIASFNTMSAIREIKYRKLN